MRLNCTFLGILPGRDDAAGLDSIMRGTSGTSQRDRPDDDRPNDGQQEDASTAQAQAALSALLQDWQHIAEQMQTDLETFNKQRGDEAGGMMQNLRAVNRESTTTRRS